MMNRARRILFILIGANIVMSIFMHLTKVFAVQNLVPVNMQLVSREIVLKIEKVIFTVDFFHLLVIIGVSVWILLKEISDQQSQRRKEIKEFAELGKKINEMKFYLDDKDKEKKWSKERKI